MINNFLNIQFQTIPISEIKFFDVFIPFISAFAGAWFAYRFNIKQDENKTKKYNIENFIILSNLTSYLATNIFQFKKTMTVIDKMDYLLISNKFYIPEISFPVEIEDYVFLSEYNSNFLTQLAWLKECTNIINERFKAFASQTLLFNNNLKNNLLNENDVHVYLESFKTLLKEIDTYILNIHLFSKYLKTCYIRYFSLGHEKNNYFDLNTEYESLLPEPTEQHNNSEKYFNENWAKPITFWKQVKNIFIKTKVNIISFYKYFSF